MHMERSLNDNEYIFNIWIYSAFRIQIKQYFEQIQQMYNLQFGPLQAFCVFVQLICGHGHNDIDVISL